MWNPWGITYAVTGREIGKRTTLATFSYLGKEVLVYANKNGTFTKKKAGDALWMIASENVSL